MAAVSVSTYMHDIHAPRAADIDIVKNCQIHTKIYISQILQVTHAFIASVAPLRAINWKCKPGCDRRGERVRAVIRLRDENVEVADLHFKRFGRHSANCAAKLRAWGRAGLGKLAGAC